MSEVPKIVRQRLQSTVAGEHPDANVLAAFSEQSLSGKERAQVLAHLGACAACREVVSLAVPEVAPPLPHTDLRPQWTRWPVLRWAGLAAAGVVVAAAVIVQNARRSAPAIEAVRTETGTPAQPKAAEAASNEAAAKREQDRAADQLQVSVPVHTPRAAETKKDVAQAPTAQKLSRQASHAVQANQQAAPQAVAELSAQSSMTRQRTQSSENVAVAPPPQAGAAAGALGANQRTQLRNMQAPTAPAAPQVSSQVMDAATEAGPSQVEPTAKSRRANVMKPTAGPRQTGPVMESAVYATSPPRWRVSDHGAIERSVDGGQHWQTVAIRSAGAVFRSVASLDGEVWAGGSSGTLYHSADNGRTWKRVTVQAGDAVLAGDIVRVEFSNDRNGAVTTAGGETWSTADGGATWSRAER